jgi:hypothetical protein
MFEVVVFAGAVLFLLMLVIALNWTESPGLHYNKRTLPRK